MPTRLIENDDGMCAMRNGLRDLCQVQTHSGAVAPRQDQAGAGSACRADGTEDVGRGRALISRRRWPRSALRPTAGYLVLLTNPGLVLEPDLYRPARSIARRDLRHPVVEVFLNAATASGFW